MRVVLAPATFEEAQVAGIALEAAGFHVEAGWMGVTPGVTRGGQAPLTSYPILVADDEFEEARACLAAMKADLGPEDDAPVPLKDRVRQAAQDFAGLGLAIVFIFAAFGALWFCFTVLNGLLNPNAPPARLT